MKKDDLSTFEITRPFQFNPWKHHFFFILNEIKSIRDSSQIPELNQTILRIGNSLTDLYTGLLTIPQILFEISLYLSANKLSDCNQFIEWINDSEKSFHKIYLSDGSFWILRLCDDKNKYIHLHPGKYSPHTLRIRSLTLKTAILTIAKLSTSREQKLELPGINIIRKKYLGASPIKNFSASRGLGKLIALFTDHLG